MSSTAPQQEASPNNAEMVMLGRRQNTGDWKIIRWLSEVVAQFIVLYISTYENTKQRPPQSCPSPPQLASQKLNTSPSPSSSAPSGNQDHTSIQIDQDARGSALSATTPNCTSLKREAIFPHHGDTPAAHFRLCAACRKPRRKCICGPY
jgi:hypothetical protein